MIWLMSGKYTSFLTNINTFLVSKSNEKSDKISKAKKWNINIVNGVWLMELYLGNTYALAKPLDERYQALDVQNHFYYDQLLTRDYMDQWRQLINLPIEVIRQHRLNSPLKQINRQPLVKYNRSISPSNDNIKNAKM